MHEGNATNHEQWIKRWLFVEYEETFNKEKVIFENTKVIYLHYYLFSFQNLQFFLFFF